MQSSTTHSGIEFVQVLTAGCLILVVLIPALWSRVRRRPATSAPTYRRPPSRRLDANLTDSQGIPCVHCPHVAQTFVELSTHQRFDCPGLRRKT